MSLTKFLTFMIKNILSLFVIFSFHYLEGTFEHAAKNPKILVLVIASETPLVYQKTYQQLQDVWKSYMHLDPEHVEAYFIKGDPDLSTPYKIIDDTVWTKTVENYRPGILNKTILSLDAFFPRLNEFDYVLRTNLSSFYVFPKLLEFIKTLPKKGCYCGLREERDNISWAFGGGFILSRDMVEMLLKNKKEFLNNSDEADDVLIGIFMEKNKIGILSAPIFNLTSIERWQKNKDLIPKDQFHFRVKNSQERFRSTEEIYIQKELVKMFYNIKLPELTPKEKIENIYTSCCAIPSDINEHLYLLKNLASESSSFSEIGVRSMVSTSGILMGLLKVLFNQFLISV